MIKIAIFFFKGWRDSVSEGNLQSRNGKIELNDYAQKYQQKNLQILKMFNGGRWEGGLVGNQSLFAKCPTKPQLDHLIAERVENKF